MYRSVLFKTKIEKGLRDCALARRGIERAAFVDIHLI